MLTRIAVHLDTDSRCASRVHDAARLAARHQATLTGIYASFRHPHQLFDEISIPLELDALLERDLESDKQRAYECLDKAAADAGVQVHHRTQRGMPEDILCRESRYHDLLVMSQPDPASPEANPSRMARLIAAIMLGAGRPVLLLPNQPVATAPGTRVLLCWDQGREAARALADARPVLSGAEQLHVLTVGAQSGARSLSDDNRADLLAYCAAHGLPQPHIVEHRSGSHGIGDIIVRVATDQQCDLIVMGAYGHGRLQQAIMGGTTRKVFERMPVPVLLSH